MFLGLHRWDFDVSYVSHVWLSLKVVLPRICMCECINIYMYLHIQDPFQMGFKLLIQVTGKKEKGNKAQAILSPTRVNECACVCTSASIHVTMHPWEDRRESAICPSLRSGGLSLWEQHHPEGDSDASRNKFFSQQGHKVWSLDAWSSNFVWCSEKQLSLPTVLGRLGWWTLDRLCLVSDMELPKWFSKIILMNYFHLSSLF